MKHKLLIVEDYAPLLRSLVNDLAPYFDVLAAGDGREALNHHRTHKIECTLLDLALPDMDGRELCRRLRQRGLESPIIALSIASDDDHKIDALSGGFDCYLAKPCATSVIIAQVRAVLKRQSRYVDTERRMQVADVSILPSEKSVTRAGKPVRLRPKEFGLLECLMANAGKTVSREYLHQTVWQGARHSGNTVDVHIKYLRDGIDRPFSVQRIKTIHGRGYRFDDTVDGMTSTHGR